MSSTTVKLPYPPIPENLVPLNQYIDERPHLHGQQMNNRVLDWMDFYDYRPDLGIVSIFVDPDAVPFDDWLDHVYLRVAPVGTLLDSMLAGIELYELFFPDELELREHTEGASIAWFYCWWD